MFQAKRFNLVFVALVVLAGIVAWQSVVAEDVVHKISGIAWSVDNTTKTMVVKVSDGTEYTITWTDKTTVEAAKGTRKGVENVSAATYEGAEEGTWVTVKYTEKDEHRTAVAIKEASKAKAKAAAQR